MTKAALPAMTASNLPRPMSMRRCSKGCQTCHDPHMADQTGLLSKAPDALCASCHATGAGKFVAAHQDYPVTTHCLDCHAQHSANQKGLLKEVIHAPVKSGDCNECHQVKGTAITVKKVPGGLCLPVMPTSRPRPSTCRSRTATASPVMPSMAATMPACSPWRPQGLPGMPRREHRQGGSVHAPVEAGQLPGLPPGPQVDRQGVAQGQPPALCFSCHDRQAYADRPQAHPPARDGRCADCHTPHDSALKEAAGQAPGDPLLGLSPENPGGDVPVQHAQAVRPGGVQRLPHPPWRRTAWPAHEEHGQGRTLPDLPQGTGRENGGGPRPCALCRGRLPGLSRPAWHRPCQAHQGAAGPAVLLLPCRLRSDDHQNKVRHSPVAKLECNACHSGHGSPHAGFLKKGQPALCLGCHGEIAKFWKKGVKHSPAAEELHHLPCRPWLQPCGPDPGSRRTPLCAVP